MSALTRRVSPWVSQLLSHPRTRATRRSLFERQRRLRGQAHRIRYFHQVDDPYSHLAAQVLGVLLERYDVVLEPCLVGPPPDDAAPERSRLEAFARKDAADVAPGYGLDFPAAPGAPAAAEVTLAARLLAAAATADCFVEMAPRIGGALWRRDRPGLEAIASQLTPADEAATRAAIDTGTALRQHLGHYLGAMLYYGGEWYWGVDRLWHLERRLQQLGTLRSGMSAAPIAPRPDPSQGGPVTAAQRLRLEYYPSLRSPYSAIAMGRVLELPKRLPVELVLRPVLPMVMRGLPVPRAKRLYILLDTQREAEDAGEPFGRVCDPVGRPIERGFSLFPWARAQGRGGEFLAEFTRAAFADGIDTGSDAGLRTVVQRAGLAWEAALPHLDSEGWADELEANRQLLLELGLWGVPSFRLLGEGGQPDFCTWGQDRIWRVEQEIRRRIAGGPRA